MTRSIPQWRVKVPRDHRTHIFESEAAALQAAKAAAWTAEPSVVTAPDGTRYAVLILHPTVDLITVDGHSVKRVFGGAR